MAPPSRSTSSAPSASAASASAAATPSDKKGADKRVAGTKRSASPEKVVAAVPEKAVATKEPRKKVAAATVPATTVTATPVDTTTPPPAKRANKKAAATVDEVVVPVPELGATDAVEGLSRAELTEQVMSGLFEQSAAYYKKLGDLATCVAQIKTDFRTYEKKAAKELKTALKNQPKRKQKRAAGAACGFVTPSQITDELASFLEVPLGTEMSRTEVTRQLSAYIRAHQLQNPEKGKGREILPDARLKALLQVNETDNLTFFTLQKFLSPHFPKKVKAVETSSSV
jgi:chromatin remodeling complex protein RSC6